MKKFSACSLGVLALLLAVSVGGASIAEARLGGGRSSGFRGSRSFGTRSAPSSPSGNTGWAQPQQNYSAPQQPSRPMGAFGNSAPSSGGFMRGMMGGLAGGMIGSMLFRNSGYAGGSGASGGGGMGLLEILVLCGLGFFIYRYFANRKMAAAAEAYQQTPMGALRSMEPGPFANQEVSEAQCASTLTRYDASFDLMRFKDERMDDFLKLQAAWGTRDLSGISGMIGSELQRQFEEDLAKLKANQQFNRIENIAVRSSDLIEAWQEYGKEFATVRFRANLHDYTIDENSGQVVAGDKTLAVKFEEDWTFVRAVDDARSANAWKLTAIEA